jgi:DUF3093 family protein
MLVYRERLRVPLSWWLLGLTAAGLLGTELMAGFGWQVAAVVYGVLGGGYAAMLVWWGRARVEITRGELRAGSARLPLAAAGQVTALAETQTRQLRGPRADPAAMLLSRPYLRRAVYVEVSDPGLGVPYWLVGTRRPAALAAAIEGARPVAQAGGAAMG